MKNVKERLYQSFCRIFCNEIIRDGFRGVLGHDPDENALIAYESSFPELGLEGVVKDLAANREHWEKIQTEHASDLIDEVFQGILGRPADSGGATTYGEVLRRKGLSGVVEGLSRSDECWHRVNRLEPRNLLSIFYRGLLQREPDEGGLNGKANKIRQQIPWEELIEEMIHSPEFLAKRQSLLRGGGGSPWEEFLGEISDFSEYDSFLRRRPSGKEEIAAFITSGKRVTDLKRERLERDLKDPGSMRVLLIGAYGNGNLGDAYQAVALERMIIERYAIPAEQIHAASHNDISEFPFASGRVISRDQLMDPEFVNGFGMIVIGGGGLLAHPHAPLRDSDGWVQSVHAPLLLHAVGATHTVSRQCSILLRKVVALSGRDEESVAALHAFRTDCFLEEDPILAASSCEELEVHDAPVAKHSEQGGIECLWILKYPSDEKDRDALNLIREVLCRHEAGRHRIVAIEPARDRVLDEWFPGFVHYCSRLRELNGIIRASRKVVSMRYHGAILAQKSGTPTYGFSQQKIKTVLPKHGDYFEVLDKETLRSIIKNDS